MGYIEDDEHFANYLRRSLRSADPPLDMDEVLPLAFYIEHIYAAGLGDKFTWALRNEGPELLEEEQVLAWMRENRQKTVDFREVYHTELTPEFWRLLEETQDTAGVYSFWSESGTLLYIGSSQGLGKRILTSFRRFASYGRTVICKYIATATDSDAVVLESYLIATLRPAMNRAGVYRDLPSLELKEIPDWTEGIVCNEIEEIANDAE